MNNKPFIYLAGGLSFFKQKGKNTFNKKVIKWREKTSEWMQDNKIPYFDPLVTFKRELAHKYTHSSVVNQNKHYLNKTDILIVCLDKLDKSFGTIFEMIYARTVLNIPIIAFGKCNKYKYSPHFNYCITECFDNIEEVIEYISIMYIQE